MFLGYYFTLNFHASIAQLDRASDFGSEGWGFDSLWAYHLFLKKPQNQIYKIEQNILLK